MKYMIVVLCLFLLLVPGVWGFCEEEQVDINFASLSELEELIGIGPVKAQAIIDARDFEDVDDLINVNGIGEITLEKIKEQSLACVGEEQEVLEEFDEPLPVEPDFVGIEERPKPVGIKMINLNPKDIKEDDNSKSNTKYIYGLAFFCVLLIFLFMLKYLRER